MIESGELGRYLGYTKGYDLPLAQRKRIATLVASDAVQDGRTLARIISDATPELPRGLVDGGLHGNYAEEFKTNFLDGAARRK